MYTFWQWLVAIAPSPNLCHQEALLLPNAPVRAGMSKINPFPATQRKLKRLFPIRPAQANVGSPTTPLSPTSQRPTPKPIPSPLQSAQDGFAGFF
jgi:hypothetical protein